MCAFTAISLNLIVSSSFALAEIGSYKNILSFEDIKTYKQIFAIQKKSIKNKKSKEWIKVDTLIKK